jgi:hypothetical protein
LQLGQRTGISGECFIHQLSQRRQWQMHSATWAGRVRVTVGSDFLTVDFLLSF